MSKRFDGKTILITGATSGIGHAGAIRVAEEGGIVIATGRNEKRLSALRDDLPENGIVIANDAAEADGVDELRRIVEEASGIDGLWLNVGYADVRAPGKIDAQFFDRMMATNVRGPVLLVAVLSDLIKDNGSIVVTSSTATYEGSPMASTYATTKGALISLASCWASAFGERGIRANALVPGPIDTEFRSFMSSEFREKFEADVTGRLALPRVGSAEEAAAVALFLLSDDASFVTGAQYHVDGGLVMQ